MVEAYRRLIATATAISILLEIGKQLAGLTLARKGFFDALYKSLPIFTNYQISINYLYFVYFWFSDLPVRQFCVSQALGFAVEVARAQRS